MPNFAQSFLLLAIIHGVKLLPTASFQISPINYAQTKGSSTTLNGKLWDKLEIEPDPLDEEAGWYLMNCIVGSEMDLLAQAKYVTRDIATELVEKLCVPTERKLRSHGKKQNVVEVKVMYPGYVFCKMRICAETYEPLQALDLCRSWMAGTVNQKGYKKLPPAPIALSDEEVAKFKGLEEQSDAMLEKFGEGYTGRGDDGADLIAQYEGYGVENMVKVLEGNFKGEDGVVRRLKDGLIMVRLYTYGNVLDQWFKPNEIRPMTDAEAMKGLTGPTNAVNQDEFDISIGKTPRSRDTGGRGLRNELNNSMGGGGRMRRQDRTNRGETGRKDSFGRSEQEIKEEEQNWRQFREEQRASQQQKRGDMWGIKERTSWDGGDNAAQFSDDGKWKSGRQMRSDKKKMERENSTSQVQDAIDGGSDWDFFADSSSENESGDKGAEDDFFNSLMTELSDTLEETPEKKKDNRKQEKTSSSKSDNQSSEDDFFTDLMSQLSESVDDNSSGQNDSKRSDSSEPAFSDDDFFASLEADLNESLQTDASEKAVNNNSSGQNDNKKSSMDETPFSDDDFFASLESDLNESLNKDSSKNNSSPSDQNDFFAGLGEALDDSSRNKGDKDSLIEDDFFASLESELGEALGEEEKNVQVNESSDVSKISKPAKNAQTKDLNKFTVPVLKDMLRERGLKLSGKKSDLIARLNEN
jgi:transcription antitermination factor NusG